MPPYSIQPRDGVLVIGYELLFLTKNMSKNIGKI